MGIYWGLGGEEKQSNARKVRNMSWTSMKLNLEVQGIMCVFIWHVFGFGFPF